MHVPYRGAAPAVTDLLAGQVDMILADVPVLLPHIRGGALRALAIAAPERARPPCRSCRPWPRPVSRSRVRHLVRPAGARRHAARPDRRPAASLVAALADAETRRALLEQGGDLVGGTPDEFAAFLREETAKWGEVIRAAQIKME